MVSDKEIIICLRQAICIHKDIETANRRVEVIRSNLVDKDVFFEFATRLERKAREEGHDEGVKEERNRCEILLNTMKFDKRLREPFYPSDKPEASERVWRGYITDVIDEIIEKLNHSSLDKLGTHDSSLRLGKSSKSSGNSFVEFKTFDGWTIKFSRKDWDVTKEAEPKPADRLGSVKVVSAKVVTGDDFIETAFGKKKDGDKK